MVDSGKMVVRAPQQCQSSFSGSRFSEQQVACSQCLRGRVVLEAYSVGKALHDAGVVSRRLVQLHRLRRVSLTLRCSPQISALDMTCEAVVTKMAYLLSLKVISPSLCQIILRHNPPPSPPSPSLSPAKLSSFLLCSLQLLPSDLRIAFKTSLRGELTGRSHSVTRSLCADASQMKPTRPVCCGERSSAAGCRAVAKGQRTARLLGAAIAFCRGTAPLQNVSRVFAVFFCACVVARDK